MPSIGATERGADMEDLLFLAQRIPYPPNKGDKIRSWQILRHLATRYRVHLGCLYDDADDAQYIPYLSEICASLCCRPLHRARAKLRLPASFAKGEPITLGHFRDARLGQWVDELVQRRRPSRAYIFSSAMAPYLINHQLGVRVLDMVDVDSEKWRAFATTARLPWRQIYAREGRRLLQFERRAALEFDATLFATPAEARLFTSLAPEAASRVAAMRNGVDLHYFDPSQPSANPYPRPVPVAVFTGAMDYWPNIEAATWFVHAILPIIRAHRREFEFWIVGRNPTSAILRFARSAGVFVTGAVPDVRPYLAHSAVAVAPMTIARGVQNKVIEAMAMAKPVVATPGTGAAVDAAGGEEIFIASSPHDFAAAIEAVLSGRHTTLGARARARIEKDYRWRFDVLDDLLDPADGRVAAAGY
jgi:sugar transferase (PEP-CTERM/EpsH1 system associated)